MVLSIVVSYLLWLCLIARARGSVLDNDFTGHKLKERAVFHTDDAGYALVNKGDAMKTSLHDVIFAIKQHNLDVLNEVLYSVSDPQSSEYGKPRSSSCYLA